MLKFYHKGGDFTYGHNNYVRSWICFNGNTRIHFPGMLDFTDTFYPNVPGGDIWLEEEISKCYFTSKNTLEIKFGDIAKIVIGSDYDKLILLFDKINLLLRKTDWYGRLEWASYDREGLAITKSVGLGQSLHGSYWKTVIGIKLGPSINDGNSTIIAKIVSDGKRDYNQDINQSLAESICAEVNGEYPVPNYCADGKGIYPVVIPRNMNFKNNGLIWSYIYFGEILIANCLLEERSCKSAFRNIKFRRGLHYK